MSDTAVSLLTPPGTGAIATVEVRGPRAWELARKLFQPAGKPLPESPEVNRFWLGTLGSDEVILAATGEYAIEVHCHGGRRVVRWVIEQFTVHGYVEERTHRPKGEGFYSRLALELLPHAPTLRTASILLDQASGKFATAVQAILYFLENTPAAAPTFLRQLARFAPVGRHIVEPWKVVVAGPPNVGKSSLVNALAGYQRSVVSEVAGTTRDAVSVRTAFNGWPIELIDTAGLRDTEGLEADGVERAERELEEADLVLWMMDGTATKMIGASRDIPVAKLLNVINKSDAMVGWVPDPNAGDWWGTLLVSALTGEGVGGVVAATTQKLIPSSPESGQAIPFTPRLAEIIEAANAALVANQPGEAAQILREALAEAE